jgi:hypothetical protein
MYRVLLAIITALIAIVVFVYNKPAVSKSENPYSPEAVAAVTAWGECQANNRLEMWSNNSSSEEVAEAVMNACMKFEHQLTTALQRKYGPTRAASTVKEIHESYRARGVLEVNEMRGGPPVLNPASVWGKCLGRKMKEFASKTNDAEAAANATFISCAEFEKVLYDETLQRAGAAQAELDIKTFKVEVRRRMIEMLNQQE